MRKKPAPKVETAQVPAVQDQLPVQHQAKATSLLEAITAAASNPNTDIEKMERLFAMHEKMVKMEAEKEFNAAMSRAQSRMVPVVHNASNEQTHSRYAKLAAITAAIAPIYTAEGLSLSFDTTEEGAPPGHICIIAIVSHAGGHSRRHRLPLPIDNVGSGGKVNKTMVHATGSTNSYGRRYLTLMIFNVSTQDEDKDGNAEGPTEGMSDEAFNEFKKRIEDQTTKDKAKAVWQEAIVECEKLGDVGAAQQLKDVLIAHGKFIDEAAKVPA